MTRFSKLELDKDGKLIETNARIIPQSAIQACPHYIMVAEHYRADNSCRCDDPWHYHEMQAWGYTWDGSAWITPKRGFTKKEK